MYIIQTRIEGQIRRMVIGKHGEMDFRTARRRVRDLLARIRAGENPAEEARVAARMPTFKVFAQEYVLRCDSCWRPSGRKTVRIYLKARILPAFGRMRLDEIEPEDVGEWFAAASQDKPGAANRELEILRAMMSRAEEWGWLERDSNLCLNIRKNARHQIPRFLDRQELERLGRTLDLHERRGGSLGRELDRTTNRAGGRSGHSAYRRATGWAHRRGVPVPALCPGAGARTVSECAGVRCARRPNSAGCGCTIFATRWPVRPSCLAKTYLWWVNCSGTGGTAGCAHLADEHLVEAAEKVGGIIAEAMQDGKMHHKTQP